MEIRLSIYDSTQTYPLYKLHVEAADLEGHGFSSTCVVFIKVTDSNDHAPRFSQNIVSSLHVGFKLKFPVTCF